MSVKKSDASAQADQSGVVKFAAVRPQRAFEEIINQIRAELMQGRLKIGSKLPSERAMALQFGVSRNTLREALRSLEHAGLLRLQKGAAGGAFISARSGDAIATSLIDMFQMGSIKPEDLTQARIWLESILVREACSRATREDIEELYKNIKDVETAEEMKDYPLRSQTNVEFHHILARISGNPIMVIMMDGLMAVLKEYISKIGYVEQDYLLPSRRRFMQNLIDGDADAAVKEMESLLRKQEEAYLSRIGTET